MNEIANIFHFDEGKESFEDLGKPNGVRYWMESDLMIALEYSGSAGFRKVILRAMQACLTLGIPTDEVFVNCDGSYKLTRFACYLIAMNGDTKKPAVASAQLYFATLAETFNRHLEHVEGIERIVIRQEMSDGMKTLSSTAKRHGVQNFALFQNAGYRGMYNFDLARLTQIKGVKAGEMLLDRMGKTELAANLFRISQTEEKIKNQGIKGQVPLERAAQDVGRTVRETMIGISGTAPEHLPVAEHIEDVKRMIKSTNKKFKAIDRAPKKGKKNPEARNDASDS